MLTIGALSSDPESGRLPSVAFGVIVVSKNHRGLDVRAGMHTLPAVAIPITDLIELARGCASQISIV